jgi:hypothetical protein
LSQPNDLDVGISLLVAAYRQTLRASDLLGDAIERALVFNAVAESARQARYWLRTRGEGPAADAAASQLDQLLVELEPKDQVNRAFGLVKAHSGKLLEWGFQIGGAAGFAVALVVADLEALGRHLVTGLLASGVSVPIVFGAIRIATSLYRRFEEVSRAPVVGYVANGTLVANLNDAERDFFRRIGKTPPARRVIEAAGPVGTAALWLPACVAFVAVGAIVYGAYLYLISPVLLH